MKNKLFTIILSLILGTGCQHVSYNANNSDTERILPEHATNIVDLGNNWITFDIVLRGKKRCFLYHKAFLQVMDMASGFEAISELSTCD